MHDASIMHKVCTAQTNAVSKQWFLEHRCNTMAGHFDMTLYDLLTPALRNHTLVIVTMRNPIDLLISLYHYLPTPGEVYMMDVQGTLNVTLAEFAQGESGLGIDLNGGMTKMLAGDYCCYNTNAPIYEPAARLNAAFKALHTKVGVVLLQERFDESLTYLAYVLGWANPQTDIRENVNSHSKKNIPREDRRIVEGVVQHDIELYRRASDVFKEQMEVYNYSPYPVLPRWNQ